MSCTTFVVLVRLMNGRAVRGILFRDDSSWSG